MVHMIPSRKLALHFQDMIPVLKLMRISLTSWMTCLPLVVGIAWKVRELGKRRIQWLEGAEEEYDYLKVHSRIGDQFPKHCQSLKSLVKRGTQSSISLEDCHLKPCSHFFLCNGTPHPSLLKVYWTDPIHLPRWGLNYASNLQHIEPIDGFLCSCMFGGQRHHPESFRIGRWQWLKAKHENETSKRRQE